MSLKPLTVIDDAFPAFGQNLINIALPILSEGYGRLVKELREDRNLAALAKEVGIDVALSSDEEAIAAYRKRNKELVTRQEKEAEKAMGQAIKQQYPEHSIAGEELGYKAGTRGILWMLDPTDGTTAMMATAMAEAFDLKLSKPTPSFGITAGTAIGDEAVFGIVAELCPQDGTLIAVNAWIGAKGFPTVQNGRPVVLPPVPVSLKDATVASTVPPVMFKTEKDWGKFQAIQEATGRPCVTGQNCVGFMRLLQKNGGIHVVIEGDLTCHDIAALVPILEGSGIIVTDHNGDRLKFSEDSIGQEFRILAAQQSLHAQALQCARRGVPPERNHFLDNRTVIGGNVEKFAGPH